MVGGQPQSLEPDAVHRIRADRHLLSERSEKMAPAAIAQRVCGLQAQVASTPGLALLPRTSVEVDSVRAAVDGRELALTWAMRGTLHLIPRIDVHRYAAAVGSRIAAQETRLWPRHDVAADDEDRVNGGILRALCDGPLERGKLAERVGADLGPEVGELLRHPWGIGLKPAVAQGLVSVLSRGPSMRLSLPEAANPAIEESEAQRWLAGRYLAANVIGDAATFATWSGLTRSSARAALDAVAERTIKMRDSIWYTAGDLTDPGPTSTVRLLPVFDPFTLSVADRDGFCPGDSAAIWRKGGWVSAVILQDGRSLGTWKATRSKAGVRITYMWFDPRNASRQESLGAHEARVAAMLKED